MESLKAAEEMILAKIHKTNPHLKYALKDLIDGVSYKEISEKYGLVINGVRNLKSRYKVYIDEYDNGKEKEE